MKKKRRVGHVHMYSIWASTRSSSAPITPGTEGSGCSSSSGGGVNLTERLCPPDVRKREQPAALPGRATIITYISMAIFCDRYCTCNGAPANMEIKS